MGQPKSDNNQGSLKNIAIIMDGNGRWAKSNKLQITRKFQKQKQ
jgi:undecaprenyl pyrophosphate synthase